MNPHFTDLILKSTQAESLQEDEVIQTLWSGYGQILRVALSGSPHQSVVVKHVQWPTKDHHPRGWNTDISHQRKVQSYEIESNWYAHWNNRCSEHCRTPKCLELEHHNDEVLMVLEDLDASGFSARKSYATQKDMNTCLSWLAHFHATFLGERGEGLWKQGTYWHLATRPEELEQLNDLNLKNAAPLIDAALEASPYQTIVHGDAKLANFCFSSDGYKVAAVDFQYVGGGCGMKDVAYFISSCLHEEECERLEMQLLDFYFSELKTALQQLGKDIDADALEADWRALYPVAWTDFYRFLQGWSPGHWKIHQYSERLATEVLHQLK